MNIHIRTEEKTVHESSFKMTRSGGQFSFQSQLLPNRR